MKKLVILLIIVLVGVIFIGMLPGPSIAVEQNLPSVVASLSATMKTFSVKDIEELNKRVTPEELSQAATLKNQWVALLKVATEANNIKLGR